MSAPTTAGPAKTYLSGFCGYSGLHGHCRPVLGDATCRCSCHQPEPQDEAPATSNVDQARPGPGLALAAVAAAVDDLSSALLGWPEQAPELELLDALQQARTVRQQLAQLEAILEAKAAAAMSGDVVQWPGGRAERRGGANRTAWDDSRVVGRLAQHAAVTLSQRVDTTTGEVTVDHAAADTARAAVVLAFTAARPSWRVTALRELGVRYDDACTTERGRRTVQLLPATAAPGSDA